MLRFKDSIHYFLDIIILLGEVVTKTVCDLDHIRHNARLACSLQCFPQFLVIAYLLLHLSERLETFSMISEEHWENNEISFQNVFKHRELVKLKIRGMPITNCVCDILFYRFPCMKKENLML